MAGNSIPSRQPAARVGGQRRRLSRAPPRNAVPRSQTLPVLDAGSESGASHADSESEPHGHAAATHAQEGANVLPASQSMANFHPPSGGVTDDSRPRDHSPVPTTGSASSATTDIKTKHSLLSVNTSRKQSPLVTSPLPPATPTKAQRVLGTLDETAFKNFIADDENEAPKPTGFWGTSMKTAKKMLLSPARSRHQPDPYTLTLPPNTTASRPEELETNFVDRIGMVETGRPMQYAPDSNACSGSEDAALRQRPHPKTVNKHLAQKDKIDRLTPITEASRDSLSTAYRGGESNTELDVIDEYTDQYRPYSRQGLPQRLDSLKPIKTSGLYELGPEDVSPIDDGSERRLQLADEGEEVDAHSATPVETKAQQPGVVQRRSPLQVVEDRFLDVAEAELEAKKRVAKLAAKKRIAELEAKKYAAELEVKKYDAELKVLKYNAELEAAKLDSPKEDMFAVHGTPIALSKAKLLPAIQGQDLTPFEIELERIRQQCDDHDATRKAMDAKVAGMYLSHQAFKKEFEPFAARVRGDAVAEEVEEEDDDDDDLVSISSSIDLDEEPTLHVATAMTITRVTPGMVKLIDIPPRRNKKAAEKEKEEMKK
ncbi:hypothetical protein HBI56_179390 [Parastagonospora nodorum]|uniref:Uncharacterized protein n=1 Tax=Phaeosphaeria nodorum (strain SN15 / ATCC MYA-4574 / FGSC 10173) TaxID=321614 RepID=A0A7U2HWA4_PHANO|nr:hypothetical protein HBH56_045870 [Parastagonospora nodorum]QRC92654.1 hypothetical protein JI435_082920 [Parastagonospora nodorum SN15]KAH3933222.1 hypothetical protein HBH54_073620 [Parastagonospora nodorum]KAH3946319.1 hypothetical protein HBH53_132770 [Parastagonospora nodorum]KAH3973314.1 hypothetical protein HBH52_145670 [Parastagonospora nodorum]